MITTAVVRERPSMDLVEAVSSDDRAYSAVAEDIVSRLQEECNETVVRLAARHLSDECPDVRAAALNIVADCVDSWPLDFEPASALLESLRDRDQLVRLAALRIAARTIQTAGYEAYVGDLIHCLEDRSGEIRQAAVEILATKVGSGLDAENVAVLSDQLSHREASTKIAACEVLLANGHHEIVDLFTAEQAGSTFPE